MASLVLEELQLVRQVRMKVATTTKKTTRRMMNKNKITDFVVVFSDRNLHIHKYLYFCLFILREENEVDRLVFAHWNKKMFLVFVSFLCCSYFLMLLSL